MSALVIGYAPTEGRDKLCPYGLFYCGMVSVSVTASLLSTDSPKNSGSFIPAILNSSFIGGSDFINPDKNPAVAVLPSCPDAPLSQTVTEAIALLEKRGKRRIRRGREIKIPPEKRRKY